MTKETDLSTNSRNEVKLAVMAEKISNIESNVSEIKASIETLQHSIDNGYAKKIELDEYKGRLKTLENQRDWAVKIIVGAVIVAVLALVGINAR